MIKQDKLTDINDIFPLFGSSGDVLISKYGDYALLYEVHMPELNSLDAEDYTGINSAFTKAVNQLPEELILQRSDFCYPDLVTVDPDPGSYLDKRFAYHIGERPIIRNRSYFTFIRRSKLVSKHTLFSNFLQVKKGYFTEDHYSAPEVYAFEMQVAKFLESITTAYNDPGKKITFTRLNGEDAWELCAGKYFSGDLTGGKADNSPEIDNSLPEQLIVGNQYVNVFAHNTDGYPQFLETSVLDDELSRKGHNELEISMFNKLAYTLPFPHILTNVYFPLNQRQAKESLESKLKLFSATAIGSSYNAAKLKNLSDFINALNEHEQLRLIGHYFNVIVLSSVTDRDQHLKNLALTANRLDDKGVRYNRQNHSILNSFMWSMPGAARMIPEDEYSVNITEHMLCYQIWEGNTATALKGVRFCDRKSGVPLQVDLWNYPGLQNHNQVTIGPSGTGKSFLLGHIVRHYIHQQTDVVIVDIGASYKKLSILEKEVSKLGTIIESNKDNPFNFNPFLIAVKQGNAYYLRDAYDDGEDDKNDKLNFISSLIFTAWKAENEKISTEVYTVLTEMIELYYAYFNERSKEEMETRGSTTDFDYPNFKGFYNFFLEQFKKVYPDLSEKHFDLQSFRLVLKAFATGQYKNLFNCATNPDIFNDRFVIFELEYIKDDKVLFPITALLIMQVVIQKMIRQKKTRKLYFLLDEVWKILSSSMQPFVKYMYKTARKHGGGINIATQEFKDINSSGIGDTIIGNSDTKILLRQKKDVYEDLRTGFSLTQHQLDLLYSLRIEATFREVFFIFLDKAKVYRLEVSPTEVAIHTSSDQDKRAIYEDYDRHGNMQLAVKKFVEHKFNINPLIE
jgi:conjugation system TraG family ATPase